VSAPLSTEACTTDYVVTAVHHDGSRVEVLRTPARAVAVAEWYRRQQARYEAARRGEHDDVGFDTVCGVAR
jgi:hypothetical protein